MLQHLGTLDAVFKGHGGPCVSPHLMCRLLYSLVNTVDDQECDHRTFCYYLCGVKNDELSQTIDLNWLSN